MRQMQERTLRRPIATPSSIQPGKAPLQRRARHLTTTPAQSRQPPRRTPPPVQTLHPPSAAVAARERRSPHVACQFCHVTTTLVTTDHSSHSTLHIVPLFYVAHVYDCCLVTCALVSHLSNRLCLHCDPAAAVGALAKETIERLLRRGQAAEPLTQAGLVEGLATGITC